MRDCGATIRRMDMEPICTIMVPDMWGHGRMISSMDKEEKAGQMVHTTRVCIRTGRNKVEENLYSRMVHLMKAISIITTYMAKARFFQYRRCLHLV